ncbi:MAG: hypothetical protein WBA68_13770, partial [Alteraurantiacibacter sp.]
MQQEGWDERSAGKERQGQEHPGDESISVLKSIYLKTLFFFLTIYDWHRGTCLAFSLWARLRESSGQA